jgi:hypothetical protein
MPSYGFYDGGPARSHKEEEEYIEPLIAFAIWRLESSRASLTAKFMPRASNEECHNIHYTHHHARSSPARALA